MTDTSEHGVASEPSEKERHTALVARAKEIVHEIVSGTGTHEIEAELYAMPRDVLIESAWQGIAHYHGPMQAGRIVGGALNIASDQAFEREKDFRRSLLTSAEDEQAIRIANNWLDDKYGE